LIGRSSDSDVVLDFNYISRTHARIEYADSGFVVVDAGSTNGTFVNGRRISGAQALASGDHISIGDVSITFLESPSHEVQRTVPLPEDCPVRCDEATRQVWIGEEQVTERLSVQEFELLLLLSSQHGRVMPRDELAMAIWGAGNYEYNMLHRLVHRLKRKLGVHGDLIRSVAGIGYIVEGSER
jgi:DNA-binding response OmpR family regulator